MSKRKKPLIAGAFLVMILGYFLTRTLSPDGGFIRTSLIAAVQEVLMFGLPAVLILSALGQNRATISSILKPPEPYAAGLSMLSAVAYVLSAVIITGVTQATLEGLGIKTSLPEPYIPGTLPEFLVALVSAAFVPAVCEETFFRYALPMLLEKKLSHRSGVLLSSLIFSALHLTLIAVPMLMVMSLMMLRVLDRRKNLSLLFIFHGMYNFSVLLFNYTGAEPGFPQALLSIAVFVFTAKLLLKEEA